MFEPILSHGQDDPPREPRQARRHRERCQAKKTPANPLDESYLLWCRAEDEAGRGGWLLVGVADPDDGDRTARALQAATAPLPLRCELAVNSDEGLATWARQAKRRKTLLAKERAA